MNNDKKKTKVLQFICPSGFFGAERWILALAKYFIGHAYIDCQLAILHESEHQDIRVYDEFKNLGLKCYKIPARWKFDIGSIRKLTALIKKEEIDIIHTHGYKSDIIGLIAARIANVEALSTPHGFENVNDFKLQLYIRMGCIALRYFDAVAPLSDDLRKDMQNLKINHNKIFTIINGVDIDEVDCERKLIKSQRELHVKDKIIGYVGQLAHRKNIDSMIEAFDLLYEENKQVRLVIVGDGPIKIELEKKAKSLESGNKISFLGYRLDRLQLVKNMNVFTMTSSLEGIPRCMMEAMAMGVPTVAFEIPGVDKLIINNETGLMAEFGDIEGLKNQWNAILNDEKYAEKLGRAGRDHILENFSAQRMATEYATLYRLMLNRK